MPEEIQTLNTESAPSTDHSTGDLIPTLEVSAREEEPSEGTLKPDETQPVEEKKEEKVPKAETPEKPKEPKEPTGEDTRFDKHPRWQEMKRKADRVGELEAKISQLEASMHRPKPQDTPAFKDIFAMRDDELREGFDENPKEFLRNFGMQVRESVLSAVNETHQTRESEARKRAFDEGLKRTFDGFGEKHADFWEQWDDGKGPIKQFMDDNPGHNAISAYLILNSERQETERKAEVEKAVKEAVDKAKAEWTKNQKAKRFATVLGSGPSGAPQGDDDAVLKDTSKHGGFAAVMAEKIRQARRGGG